MAKKALTGKRDGDRRSAPPAPQVAMGWRNRVVGYGEIDPAACLANPANWRVHPKAQQDALAGVLDQVGWVQTVMVNRTTGHVVDGHLRVALALRREEPTIPVVYVELTAAEERLVLATLDPIGALAVTDGAQLSALLEGIKTGTAAVDALLSDLTAKADDAMPRPLIEEDEVPPVPTDPVTRVGDVITLGDHRLICGDAKDDKIVASLVQGRHLDFLVTSPPYNVGLKYSSYDDREASPADYMAFIAAVLRAWVPVVGKGRAVAWNIGVSPKTCHLAQGVALEGAGLTYCRQIVWGEIGNPPPTFAHTRNNPRARN